MKKLIHKTKISKVLKENAEQIGALLHQMYPEDKEIINYHQQQDTPFNEWFAFLFDGNKWTLDGPKEIPMNHIVISESRYKDVVSDFEEHPQDYGILLENFDAGQLGYITVVKPDDKYRLVDGYHRYYACDIKNLVNIPAYEWVKGENNNPFALQIRDLILNKL